MKQERDRFLYHSTILVFRSGNVVVVVLVFVDHPGDCGLDCGLAVVARHSGPAVVAVAVAVAVVAGPFAEAAGTHTRLPGGRALAVDRSVLSRVSAEAIAV